MPIDAIRELSTARRGLVVGPAGYGKTELIAQAVASRQGTRSLLLTHTHAGVRALRDKLKKYGVPGKAVRVDTIDGWALRYASAFPVLSGLDPCDVPKARWSIIRQAAASALRRAAVRDVVRASYDVVYVDEYQDCSAAQHQVVTTLSEILPCRIVGDPLQGIFDFSKEDPIVDWARDVVTVFPILHELETPWRWQGLNDALGQWLKHFRHCLLQGAEVELSSKPVEFERLRASPDGTQQQIAACRRAARRDNDTVVAIRQWHAECHKIAKKLRGQFRCIEPIESDDLAAWAEKLESAMGPKRAAVIIAFAKTCITKVPGFLESLYKVYSNGELPSTQRAKNHPTLKTALTEVAHTPSFAKVAAALRAVDDAVRHEPSVAWYRLELWQEMRRAVEEYAQGPGGMLIDCVRRARDRGRRYGRTVPRRTVSTTLLVKGLQFDHAVVLDATALTTKNLYVAMTRGVRSLRVLSSSPRLRPPAH